MAKKAKPMKGLIWAFEKNQIERALARCKGNVTEAAHDLDMSLRTLWRRIEQYGIKVEGFRG